MAAGPSNAAAGDSDRKKWLTILVPAAGVAGLVVAVLLVGGSGGAGRAMSDGSNGSADDAGLKEVSPGVRSRDLKAGEGEPCPPGAKVKINYTGWLADGTVFDASKAPVTFELANLIPGWQEGIPGMKPGGVRKLVIAPGKGYGAKASPKIPANSTLIFEVELVEVPPGAKASGPVDTTKLTDGTDPTAEDTGLKDVGGGLRVRDLKEGTGAACPPGATVVAHYTGWLTTGKVFDSSRTKGEPIEFPLSGVVRGWQQGIPGMKVGGVRKLVIPPDLAYGPAGRPGIPPNSTLIFEVELVEVK